MFVENITKFKQDKKNLLNQVLKIRTLLCI